MQILFLTDNFPPERNAPAIRTYEHCRYWVEHGARVTVITGVPNFPDGVVFKGYRNAWYQVEMMDGIRVVRVKTYIAANARFLRRSLDYLSFMICGFMAAIFQPRPDIVIGTSPQFFTAWAAYFSALIKRRPFILEVRDLWPDSIVEVGAMREGNIIRILRAFERFIYRRAVHIIVVTKAFKFHIMSAGVDESRITIIRNGIDLKLFRADDTESKACNLPVGSFRVGYIGTLGMAHKLDKILEAAAVVSKRDSGIQFSFTGSGAEVDKLRAMAKRLDLKNVEFRPPVPRQEIPYEWARIDLGLVPLRNSPVFSTVIPSKIFEGMASGTPLVVSVPPGEATELVKKAGVGISVPAEDPEKLADAILSLKSDPIRRKSLGEAGLTNASEFDRTRQADLMLTALKGVMDARQA